MNLSKIKVSVSNRLVKICNRLINSGSYISVAVYNLLRLLTKNTLGYQLYKIESVKNYCKKHNLNYEILTSGRIGNSWTSASNLNGFSCRKVSAPLPDIALSKFENNIITSNSDFIIDKNNGIIINDYCANNNDDNKTYVDGITLAYYRRCCLVKKQKPTNEIESGIMISGKFSFNYYHNIYENLIRILLIKEYNELIPQNVPVIIDEDVLKINSLKLIFEKLMENTERKYLSICKEKDYVVKELYYFSSINHLTPQHTNPYIEKASDFLFDKTYFERYKKYLISLKDEKTDFPKRIFISRMNIRKRNFNEESVYQTLKPLGFVMIAPETLPFEKQIALFNNAEFIVGGSGAAFTNMMFCSEDCRTIIIIGRGGNPSACFNAPAFFNGASISYYQSTEKKGVGIHMDFSVNIKDFESFVREHIMPHCL